MVVIKCRGDNMNNLELYVPKLEDFWFEELMESAPETMSYNAGYDVSYYGYHYDTGCIDFPRDRWIITYERRVNENRYFAYLKDTSIDEYVGYCNYHYVESEKRYECGIVIYSKFRGKGYAKAGLRLLCDEAKKNGVKEMYDNFEIDRGNTLKVFESVGFKVVEEQTWKKFGKDVKGVLVKIEL